MEKAIIEACDAASLRGVGLLPGAEEEVTNLGIDSWNRWLQRKYNRPDRAVIYTTYQCYLRNTPANLAHDLAEARKYGYALGVKLVRGAYLLKEPPSMVWSSKDETDRCYDELARCLLTKQYRGLLQPSTHGDRDQFPNVDVVIATHNAESVRKVQALRDEQVARGEPRVRLAYAQLQGMADEISCSLLQARAAATSGGFETAVDVPRTFKCATWGTLEECLEYLLRRAAENKDAASRTEDTRKAAGAEVWRRLMVMLR
jgi:hypothetical protein